MNAVGKNLKQLRQREKLTQDALAERLHVTRQAVSSWETGKTQPDIETLTALAEALHADIRELIYGPDRMERPYTRFQRRYIICAAVCVLILLAWAVMEWTLRPYLWRRRAEMFEIYPYMFYTFLVPPMACITAGVLLPAAASLWRDIRLGAPKLRMCLLVLGLLALIPQLLVVTAFLNLWPDFMENCHSFRAWVVPLFFVGNELLRYGPLFLSGCLLFLGLNK
ncbi:helix-turn-helix domain-containing protein [Oscillibacter valericigenes]|uniref:helix-turn-helix domain-containing protein n=1 Tax=Oscillibacter valericigenes TaxID=351091 RepID=UPI0019583B59|nr:helix-turn-helix transcriptional regulator [Oscillibacter valericigenes]MBM6908936.1 helix-turn-helix transcriptional regulator [Oscillibacter valericigenes]